VALPDHVLVRATVSVRVSVAADAVPADRVSDVLGDTVRETVRLRCPDFDAVRVNESGRDAVGLC
jgi:hypothetical protein